MQLLSLITFIIIIKKCYPQEEKVPESGGISDVSSALSMVSSFANLFGSFSDGNTVTTSVYLKFNNNVNQNLCLDLTFGANDFSMTWITGLNTRYQCVGPYSSVTFSFSFYMYTVLDTDYGQKSAWFNVNSHINNVFQDVLFSGIWYRNSQFDYIDYWWVTNSTRGAVYTSPTRQYFAIAGVYYHNHYDSYNSYTTDLLYTNFDESWSNGAIKFIQLNFDYVLFYLY